MAHRKGKQLHMQWMRVGYQLGDRSHSLLLSWIGSPIIQWVFLQTVFFVADERQILIGVGHINQSMFYFTSVHTKVIIIRHAHTHTQKTYIGRILVFRYAFLVYLFYYQQCLLHLLQGCDKNALSLVCREKQTTASIIRAIYTVHRRHAFRVHRSPIPARHFMCWILTLI